MKKCLTPFIQLVFNLKGKLVILELYFVCPTMLVKWALSIFENVKFVTDDIFVSCEKVIKLNLYKLYMLNLFFILG